MELRREIAFLDHILGIIPLTSLDDCQDWRTIHSAWCPILPQQILTSISFALLMLDNWHQEQESYLDLCYNFIHLRNIGVSWNGSQWYLPLPLWVWRG